MYHITKWNLLSVCKNTYSLVSTETQHLTVNDAFIDYGYDGYACSKYFKPSFTYPKKNEEIYTIHYSSPLDIRK